MHAHDIVTICSILAAGFVCQWIAWRVRVPAILFLLLAGILVGPILGWLDPDALLGDLLIPIVSIAVAIILFEGSLTLKFSELGGHGPIVRNLVTIGVVVTWLLAALAVYYLLGWDIYLAALFGAIVTVSGPTVVMPLLRTVRPMRSVASVLRWEAILIDPLGAILGLLVFNFVVATQQAGGALSQSATTFGLLALVGVSLGAVGGYLLGLVVRLRKVPDYLRDYFVLASVLSIFAIAESIVGESGLLAVTVMGVWLANMKHVELEDVLKFKESLTLLLVAGLFILLAARLNLNDLTALGMGAVGVLLVLQLIAGPLRALICTTGSQWTFRERLFLGWVFPRGIVAAAISALFALRLEESGYAGAEKLVPLVFAIIVGTVIIQSLSARFMANRLHVAEPDPTGVLIVGSNSGAIIIAKALQEAKVSVLLADSHWASIREARMQGIPTFYGSAVSSYADEKLELTGLGNLLALSRHPGLNELACVKFANEFGRDHVYTIANHESHEHDKHKVSGERAGRMLFGGEYSLQNVVRRLGNGYGMKTTVLSDEFDFEKYQERYPDALPVFAVDDDGKVVFPVRDAAFEPEANWAITSLVPSEEWQKSS